jgi:hypothetical protein
LTFCLSTLKEAKHNGKVLTSDLDIYSFPSFLLHAHFSIFLGCWTHLFLDFSLTNGCNLLSIYYSESVWFGINTHSFVSMMILSFYFSNLNEEKHKGK